MIKKWYSTLDKDSVKHRFHLVLFNKICKEFLPASCKSFHLNFKDQHNRSSFSDDNPFYAINNEPS